MPLDMSPRVLMVVLCVTNLINYVDRGIVPGASGSFTSFIARSRGTEAGANAAFGALQSVFIVGFSLGSVVVGHLAHSRSPFKMAAFGLVAWCLAAVLAGLALETGSYAQLILARALSGVGEAGFVTVGGPYIQDSAGAQQGAWLGIFYAAIPTGTAIGYGYGASLAVALNWSWAFYFEAAAMLPLACLFFFSKDDGSSISHNRTRAGSDDAEQEQRQGSLDILAADADAASSEGRVKTPTILEECALCVRRPAFAWVCLGYAGYAGAVIGFSTFGPSIAVGLGLWDNMTTAALAFSGALAFAGIAGTPLGGVALDAWVRARRSAPRIRAALELAIACVLVGGLVVGFAAYATNRYVFLGCLVGGCLPLFAATAAMNVAVFESVPRCNRPFGQALAVLAMHALGDVPTPILVGLLKDLYAPACTPDGDGNLGDACPSQRPQLRAITAGCALWLGWSVLAFSLALLAAARADRDAARKDLGATLFAPLRERSDVDASPLMHAANSDDDPLSHRTVNHQTATP